MRLLLNILWFILIGIGFFVLYALIGALFCVTIVLIPVGLKCFKLAGLSLHPFGRTVHIDPSDRVIRNIIWCAFCGIEAAVVFLISGVLLCLTIIGIPFGLQCFKLAKYSYAPCGATIEKED